MPYDDGILRINCYSLTDFHDFDLCPFKFFIRHHLGKKYELEEGTESLALGLLLDQAIKIFHQSKAYGCSTDYVDHLIKAACNLINEKIAKQKGPSFYSSISPFLTDELCDKAAKIFKNYYEKKKRRIKQSLGEIGFCEWLMEIDGISFKLWGGPDTLEQGDDGIPEVVDYKFRENLESGKERMDMDLMPKVYILLCAEKIKKLGFPKARFVVRFWQDPEDESFCEEFNLNDLSQSEEIFRQKIKKILATQIVNFCEKPFCKACNSPQKALFLKELKLYNLHPAMV